MVKVVDRSESLDVEWWWTMVMVVRKGGGGPRGGRDEGVGSFWGESLSQNSGWLSRAASSRHGGRRPRRGELTGSMGINSSMQRRRHKAAHSSTQQRPRPLNGTRKARSGELRRGEARRGRALAGRACVVWLLKIQSGQGHRLGAWIFAGRLPRHEWVGFWVHAQLAAAD